MELIKNTLFAVMLAIALPAMSEDHTVEMLSSSNGEMMVFKPFLVLVTDLVTFQECSK